MRFTELDKVLTGLIYDNKCREFHAYEIRDLINVDLNSIKFSVKKLKSAGFPVSIRMGRHKKLNSKSVIYKYGFDNPENEKDTSLINEVFS